MQLCVCVWGGCICLLDPTGEGARITITVPHLYRERRRCEAFYLTKKKKKENREEQRRRGKKKNTFSKKLKNDQEKKRSKKFTIHEDAFWRANDGNVLCFLST